MTETILLLLVGVPLVGVLAALVVPALAERRRGRTPTSWLEDVTRTRILVNTVDGQTLEGSLVRADADGIIIDAARHADANQTIAGVAFIPRERICWIQAP